MPLRACIGQELISGGMIAVRARRSSRGELRYEILNEPFDSSVVGEKPMPGAGCLSVNDCLTVWLDAPFETWSKTRRVLPALLDARLPFALEDCFYGFIAVRQSPVGKIQILAVAARRGNVEAQLKRYRDVGGDPVILDHAGLALWTQNVAELPLPPEATRVLLYIRADSITVVTGRGTCFHDAHALALQPTALTTESNGVDFLCSRLERTLYSEAEGDWRPHWVICAGSDAPAKLADELTRRLPERWPGPVFRPENQEAILARALAARAVTRGDWRCNLRIGNLLHSAVRDWQRRVLRRATVLALAAGLFLLAGNSAWSLVMNYRLQTVQRAVAGLAAELAPAARIPYGRETAEARRSLEQYNQTAAELRAILTADLHARIRQLIAAGAATGVAYRDLQVDDGKFTLQGAGADWDRCEMLARKLRELGWQADLEAHPADETGRAVFTIRGQW